MCILGTNIWKQNLGTEAFGVRSAECVGEDSERGRQELGLLRDRG